jgi:hypothetical protein
VTGWSPAELDAIGQAGEVRIATRRGDGTLRTARIVWIVRHRDDKSDAVYVRSVNGTAAAWYRGVQTRHEGELTADLSQHDVVFVEAGGHAGDGTELDEALDAAYRAKYGHGSAVDHITAAAAKATTLRVLPARDEDPA